MLEHFVGAFDLSGLLAWFEAKTNHDLPVYLTNFLSWAEAALSVAAAFATRMIPLRYMSMLGNAAGLAYGLGSGSLSSIVEYGVSLPLNAARARQMQKLIVAVRQAAETDLNIEWLKPFAHGRRFKAGQTIFRKGEKASEAFIVTEGEVEIPEAGARLRPGDIFGEMALFTHDGLRLDRKSVV